MTNSPIEQVGRLLTEFYVSPAYDPKAARPADTVKAAIAFTLQSLSTATEQKLTLPSREWLRKRILNDLDLETEARPATEDEGERLCAICSGTGSYVERFRSQYDRSGMGGEKPCPNGCKATLSPKVEVEPSQPVDVKQRARELLNEERRKSPPARSVSMAFDEDEQAALRAIERALSEGSDLRVRAEALEDAARVAENTTKGDILGFNVAATGRAKIIAEGIRALSPTPDTRGVKT